MKEIIHNTIAPIVSKIVLWLGVSIILSSLIYMILNLAQADNFIVLWSFCIVIGVAFVFISLLSGMMIKSSENKNIFSRIKPSS